MSRPKVWFLFNKPRAERARLYKAGQCPEEALYAYYTSRKHGFDTFFSDAGHERTIINRGLKFLDNLMSGWGKDIGFHIAQAKTLRKQLQSADLIFATADSSALPVLALKEAGLIKAPVVMATIGLVAYFSQAKGVRFALYRRLLRQASLIVHYGYGEGEMLQSVFDVPKEKLRFVPFGVQSDFFKGASERNGSPISIGLDQQRDWESLVFAAKSSQIEMELICGLGALQDKELPPNIHRLNPVSPLEIREKLHQAKFVILPVKENPYSGATITLLEAMAAGCPIVVSETSAVKKGYPLVDNKTCLLVPPGDEKALREAMERLDKDPSLRRKLGKNACSAVKKGHDISDLAKSLAGIFQEALS